VWNEIAFAHRIDFPKSPEPVKRRSGTARRIKHLQETVLAVSPDYSIARSPTFWRSPILLRLISPYPIAGFRFPS
jgi:hypothetical protein